MIQGVPPAPRPNFFMKKKLLQLFTFLAFLSAGNSGHGQEKSEVVGPVSQVFAIRGTTDLKVYVFSPRGAKAGPPRAAIVLFYGGGWAAGEPSWAFGRAQHFAERGMVAVAAQYRLSDQKEITPLDAVEDADDAIRWVRSRASELAVDPNRIAGYGWSAGAHLAACAAIIKSPSDKPVSCVPNALVLESPAVAASSDNWFRRLLGTKAKPEDLSPDEHVRSGLPPTIIVEGREDTVTPLPGVQRFVDRMKAANNRCELYVFEGAGHLFTPVGTPDDGYPKPDPTIEAAAFSKLDTFLVSLGYMK
jgi:acetyl esterase